MPTQEPTEIDKFKSAVLTAAADAVMKEMTPERMRACAETIINEALSGLNASPYHALGSLVKTTAEKVMADTLKTTEMQTTIRLAVEAGINDAMVKLPAEVKGRVIDLALAGIGNAIKNPEKRW